MGNTADASQEEMKELKKDMQKKMLMLNSVITGVKAASCFTSYGASAGGGGGNWWAIK